VLVKYATFTTLPLEKDVLSVRSPESKNIHNSTGICFIHKGLISKGCFPGENDLWKTVVEKVTRNRNFISSPKSTNPMNLESLADEYGKIISNDLFKKGILH
jgi:hypothetical protein